MHRSFSLPLNISVKSKPHHPQSDSSSEPRTRSRMSAFASVKLPSLRRPEADSSPTTTHKIPLLTLNLSSHSFLDSTLQDDSSFTLYTIRTLAMTTTILRTDPWDASIRTADIKWPKLLPAKTKGKNSPDGVLVQLAGSRWKGGDSILKQSTSLDGPRKFNIPYNSHTMRWQKQGVAYWCTSSSVKGPIATFNPPADHLPGRLTIYENLHDKYETSPMLVHKNVSILLLDYLLVTAILLVTDPQEWMLVQTPSPGSSSTAESHHNASRQWRKIAHREPLFNRLSPVTAERGDFDNNPVASTSQERMEITREVPVDPRVYINSKSMLSFSSDSDRDDGNDLHPISGTRSPSPSADSFHYPLPDDIPSLPQEYIGPTICLDSTTQPVPPLPALYATQARSFSPESISVDFLPIRDTPPPLSFTEQSPSSTEYSQDQLNPEETYSGTTGPADASLWKRRPSEPIMARSHSVTRPLPQTPVTPTADTDALAIRRVQSHNRIDQADFTKPWLRTSTVPPVPPVPAAPRTPRHGRSLPPTPFDLAMGRSEGGARPSVVNDLQNLHKSSGAEGFTSDWVDVLSSEGLPSAPPQPDHPPPAYSSIDFQCENTRL